MRLVSFILLFQSIHLFSQPLVHQEPHHIPVIENRFARVLNVVAMKGDTTQFHGHQNDIAYFTIKGSTIWLEELNQEPRVAELPTGWASSNLTHSKTPLVHRFANVGANDFHLIAVEVLTDKFSNQEFMNLGESLHKSERFSIQKVNEQTLICDVPLILIELSNSGEITTLDMIKAHRKLELKRSNESSQVIIIQLK